MKQMHKYRIFGVMLVAISILFINFDVYAASCSKSQEQLEDDMDDLCKTEDLSDYYKITLSPTSSQNEYTVSIQNENISGTHTFKITKISVGQHSYKVDGENKLVNPIEFSNKNAATINVKPVNDTVEVKVKLISATGGRFKDCLGINNQGISYKKSSCIATWKYKGKFTKTVSTSHFGDPKSTEIGYDYNQMERIKNKLSDIKTNSTQYIPDEFTTAANSIQNSTSLNKSLACEYKDKKYLDTSKNYYTNTKWFKKTDTRKEVKATYTYHYSSGKTKTKTETVCKPTCTEIVKAEYGPPVASKAGLCFEYKVKVTSYVNCTVDSTAPAPPTNEYKLCTPSPYCDNGIAKYSAQAGPTEEFESCIQECDDGKYSRKCSDKCYKEVYGKTKTSSNKTMNNSFKKGVVTKIDNVINLGSVDVLVGKNCTDSDGCYYFTPGGVINWKVSDSNKNSSDVYKKLGRWYTLNEYQILKSSGTNYFADNGIPRAIYSGGGVCQDNCAWSGCSKKSYMNQSEIENDKENNLIAWENAVQDCAAKAVCHEETAEYTIKVDYDTTKGQKMEVDFPYDSKPVERPVQSITPRTLPSQGVDGKGKDSDRCKNKKDESQAKNIILDYSGCYKNCSEENNYMTEWSFPGSWINNKNGAVSYVNKNSDDAWHEEKNKFCLPLNAATVNSGWWLWNQIGCFSDSNGNYNDVEKPTPNIKATAKNFGYFGWNFDISCFYAIKNEIINPTNKCSIPTNTQKTTDSDTTNAIINHTVRSIDTTDPFPGSSYSSSEGIYSSGVPFNFTNAAAYSNNYDLDTYIKSLQSRKIYEGTPEYEFNLTKKALGYLKTAKKKYTEFNGTFEVKSDGRTIYDSDILNNSNIK